MNHPTEMPESGLAALPPLRPTREAMDRERERQLLEMPEVQEMISLAELEQLLREVLGPEEPGPLRVRVPLELAHQWVVDRPEGREVLVEFVFDPQSVPIRRR